MIEYIPTTWIMAAFLIPIVLISIGIKNLFNKVNFAEVFATLLFAFLFYFPVTLSISVYMAAVINSLADAKGTYLTQITTNNSIYDIDWLTYGIFFGYIIFGMILFWLADKGVTKIVSIKKTA